MTYEEIVVGGKYRVKESGDCGSFGSNRGNRYIQVTEKSSEALLYDILEGGVLVNNCFNCLKPEDLEPFKEDYRIKIDPDLFFNPEALFSYTSQENVKKDMKLNDLSKAALDLDYQVLAEESIIDTQSWEVTSFGYQYLLSRYLRENKAEIAKEILEVRAEEEAKKK